VADGVIGGLERLWYTCSGGCAAAGSAALVSKGGAERLLSRECVEMLLSREVCSCFCMSGSDAEGAKVGCKLLESCRL
jgi:hypothetical protein